MEYSGDIDAIAMQSSEDKMRRAQKARHYDFIYHLTFRRGQGKKLYAGWGWRRRRLSYNILGQYGEYGQNST
jgi:hypothetical protein